MKQKSPLHRSTMFLVVGMLFLSIFGFSQNPSIKVFEEWRTTAGTQNDFQRTVVRSAAFGGAIYYYMCGATVNSSGNYDMLIRKYNSSGGVLWTQTYAGVGGGNDVATDIQVDGVGNVYVCGAYYKDSLDSTNAIIIKYNTVGTHKWTQTYNGAGSRNDIHTSINVRGNAVLVTGTTWKSTTNKYDILGMRYDSLGAVVWTATWDHNNLYDGGVSIWTTAGNVVISGGAQSSTTTYKYAVLILKASDGSLVVAAQIGGTAFGIDKITDMQTDAVGNIYVTGGVLNVSTLYDFKTVKLDTALNIVWSATYDGGSSLNDMGTGLQLDQVGNVIVTGYRTSANSGEDYVTIKYSSSGTQRWVATFDGGINADDSATCIVVSPTDTNKIYVSGYSFNGSSKDYWTLKYDGLGNLKWDIGFNNLQNGDDRATAIALDTLGNIIVAGQNKLAWNNHTYTTVKYVEKNVLMPDDTISVTSSSTVFTENRGQYLKTNKTLASEVKYCVTRSSPKLYFSDTSVSYVFSKIDSSASHNDSLTRVDMRFLNSNSGQKIRADDVRPEMSNYYLPRRGRNIERVQNYDRLMSFNVWNNVDVQYSSNQKGLKYYFICKSGGGGNPATQIDLYYSGADSVKVDANGNLIIYTKLGNIVQPKAAAWQLDANGNYQSLGWQPTYSVVGTNEVKFANFGSFNTSLPLIIAADWGYIAPTTTTGLDWSTYIGEDNRDQLDDVAIYEPDGSSHYVGQSLSTYFPTTVGALQTVNGGGWNAIVLKADSNAALVYSTFYGADTVLSSGTAVVVRNASDVDANGNYFIGGRATYSSVQHIQFPAIQPPGAYVDTVIANPTYGDAFFAAFDPNGYLMWSTYFGGTGATQEIINDLKFDSDGNLYFVMDGDSLTPHQVQGGAYNNALNQKTSLIGKFDSTLNYVWGTSFGTGISNSEAAARLTFDYSNTLYVTGRVLSGLPIVNPGGGAFVDSTYNGLTDTYLARFNTADTLTWCTYIGGAVTDNGWGLTCVTKDVYLTGYTSSTDFPLFHTGNYYFDSINGGGVQDAFIMRFGANGALKWSTLYGGTGSEQVPTDAANDQDGNVYVMGGSAGLSFPTFDPGVIYTDPTFNGSYDDFILGFNPANELIWATVFGGTAHEGTNLGIAVLGNSKIYVCGSTATTPSATDPFPLWNLGGGAYWQPLLYGNTNYDAFISRFSIDSLVIWAGVQEQPIANEFGSILVYPNPNSGEFQVNVNSEGSGKEICVYNSLGQAIQTVKLDDNMKEQTISLNLGEEAAGVYFIVLRQDSGSVSTKVIKQ